MHRTLLLVSAIALLSVPALGQRPASPEAVAQSALKAAPVWDGHNDVPEQLRDRRRNVLGDFDFADTTNTADPAKGVIVMQTDLKRLRQGRVGAQFWSVYVSATLSEPQAVQATLEQIDVMKRLIARYPGDLVYCETAACTEKAMKAGKIASLLGMEGGHSIGGSLGVLRQMHALGARYMTLTHFRNTAWADSATDTPAHDGLTAFGASVVREMQRLGMLVDLSHVSEASMNDALDVAGAPVIFSHSGAQGVNGHPRNVSDAVLRRLPANGGIVMINTYPPYVAEKIRSWNALRAAEEARLKAIHIGNPAAAKAAQEAWDKANPRPRASVADLADHVDHVVKVAGIDHVGIGGDYDGMDTVVEGMEDVSGYPRLFAELARRGWSQAALEKLSSRNMMRVLKAAEAYAAAHLMDAPIESPTSF
jgi:membrane dipeptidase